MTAFDPSELRTAYLSDVGRARSENQDACAELRGPTGARLLAVADGMGGHQGGATASRIAIDTLDEELARSPEADGEMLRRALETANDRIHRTAEEHLELEGMGTTCVVLLFGTDGAAWVAHVGDSRAYALREGELLALTTDHSTVAELVRLGRITAEEAVHHPRRNEILRSLGTLPSVEVDVSPIEVRSGDQYLLCSDGLSGLVSDPEICAVMLREPPERAVRLLVDFANERGGPDNVTVMVTAVDGATTARYAQESDPMRWQAEAALDASRRRLRRVAAAAILVAGLLVISLLALLLRSSQITIDPPMVTSPPPTAGHPTVPPGGDVRRPLPGP